MKKKLILLLAAVMFAIPVCGQWRVGLSAGASYNWYSIDRQYQADFHYQGLWAPSAALSVQYDFNGWLGAKAEVEYLRKDHRFYRTGLFADTNYKVLNTYLQVPVMAVFRFGGQRLKGFAELGGFAGYWALGRLDGTLYNFGATKTPVPVGEDYSFLTDKDNRFDAGLLAGTGMEFVFSPHWAALLEARLNYSLVSTTKQYMTIRDYRYNTTASIRLGVQYLF